MACFAVSLCLYCCHKETNSQTETNIVPVNFKVAIPSALNTPDTANSVGTFSSLAQVKSSVNSDSINGFMVYQHLRVYIAVGDSASSVIQKMMQTISKFNITKPMQLTFQGQRDNRPKLLVETDNVYFESTWQHSIIITDIIDTAVAMKIYWNLNPVKGIAILRPYEIDKKGKNLNMPNARYRIDYSEAGENGYNAQMTISISGLAINMNNSYSINNLKIFVGRQGDIIDVYGNTNHPLAKLLLKNYTEGFNWAFAASCDRIKNIAVAEIGLPPSDSDFTSREDILVKHSIKNVLTQELKTLYPNIADTVISRLLVNTNAPGFFNSIVGFVQCGSVPNSDYSDIQSRILKLTPFDPAAINSLSITFNP
jgi:hypothetical protein